DTTPVLSGLTTAGALVTLYNGDAVIGSVTADAAGQWSFTPAALDDGSYAFRADTANADGSVTSSPVLTVTIDTVAPATVTDAALTDANGVLVTGDGITNSPTPVLSGTAEPGSIVTVSDGDNVLGTTTVAQDGSWSFTTPTLAEGGHSLTAIVTDAAGNVSAASTPLTFTLDTSAPQTASGVTVTDDVGDRQGALASGDTTDDSSGAPVDLADGASTRDATPTLSGQTAAGLLVTLYNGDTAIGSVTADANGLWSFTPQALPDGDYAFRASVTDAAGNITDSATLTIAIDTAAPATATDIALADENGDPIGGLTNNNAPVLSGTAEAGSIVTVSDGDTVLGSVTAAQDGSWSFTSPALADGSHSLTAVVTDAAGNASAPTAPATFTLDTQAPVAAT
ncbi:MAG: Ig-like domain-containing protein, partial [Pantoea sp.]|uniref:Ig-like domain-containing protein n=1 Tax=Pantoea sp. TaxID=69393 RepID=UPI00290D92CD